MGRKVKTEESPTSKFPIHIGDLEKYLRVLLTSFGFEKEDYNIKLDSKTHEYTIEVKPDENGYKKGKNFGGLEKHLEYMSKFGFRIELTYSNPNRK